MAPRPVARRDGAAATGRFDRSVRFWLRAYPVPWRTHRSDELAALLADLASPGAVRVGPRAAVDLVRGGLSTRWRHRPPLATWLAYRVLDRPVPPAYRAWAAQDIDGRWYPVRQNLPSAVAVLPLVLVDLRYPAGVVPGRWLGIAVALALLVGVLTADARRAQARARHLTLRPGEPVQPGVTVEALGPRGRVGARTGARWLLTVVVLAAAGGSGLVLGYAAPGTRRATLVALALALVTGAVLGMLARRRLRRLLPRRPAQPHRTLRPPSALRVVVLYESVLLAAGLVDSPPDNPVVWLAPVLAPAATLALPLAVVLHRCARAAAATDPLALRDLLGIAVRGRPPATDDPVPGAHVLVGPVPEGAVAPVGPRLGPEPPHAHPVARTPDTARTAARPPVSSRPPHRLE